MKSQAKIYLFLLFIGISVLYISNVSPTIKAGDSGELSAAAFSLGIPHNSGYPLFAQLNKLFSLLNPGNIAFRINLLSVFFSIISLVPIYAFSRLLGNSFGSTVFALIIFCLHPLIWSTAVSGEVYPLHLFFASLLIYLALKWEKEADIRIFLLFCLVLGLSFTNHLQTVMLLPSFIFLELSRSNNRKSPLANWRILAVSLALGCLAISIYLYLPIRTNLLPPIRWGNPDKWIYFFNTISARTHRHTVVFSATFQDYLVRAWQSSWDLFAPFFFLLPLLFWGFWKVAGKKKLMVFFLLILVFDFFYTVFLNLVTLKATPFNFHSAIVLIFFLATGWDAFINKLYEMTDKKGALRPSLAILMVLLNISALLYLLGIGWKANNDRENYMAYDFGLNVLQTLDNRAVYLPDGDHFIFPIAYLVMVEKRRPDVSVYDRLNLVFKGLYPDRFSLMQAGEMEKARGEMEQRLVREPVRPVYFSSKDTLSQKIVLREYGLLFRAAMAGENISSGSSWSIQPWQYYIDRTLPHLSAFQDYMTREMAAFYLIHKARGSLEIQEEKVIRAHLDKALFLGFDDDEVVSEIGLLYKEMGLYPEAIELLDRSLTINPSSANAFNNLGTVYYERKEYKRAIDNFSKATKLAPQRVAYRNNLGIAYALAGEKEKAIREWQRSLELHKNQPDVIEYLRMNGIQP